MLFPSNFEQTYDTFCHNMNGGAAGEFAQPQEQDVETFETQPTFPPPSLATLFSLFFVRLRRAVQIFRGAWRPRSTLTRIFSGNESDVGMWHGTVAVPSALTASLDWLALAAVGGREAILFSKSTSSLLSTNFTGCSMYKILLLTFRALGDEGLITSLFLFYYSAQQNTTEMNNKLKLKSHPLLSLYSPHCATLYSAPWLILKQHPPPYTRLTDYQYVSKINLNPPT